MDGLTTALLTFPLFLCVLSTAAVGAAVPPVYVFGDSTADVGTNNYLPGTSAKADFPHNGIDFPHRRPTGRFSNGYNGADFIDTSSKALTSPPVAPASSILPEAQSLLSMQLKQFAIVSSNISARVGVESADKLLSRSIFVISTGANDMIAFFARFGSVNTTQRDEFVATLISNYEDHITTLYKLGARKFAIVGVPKIGYCPSQRSVNPNGDCIKDLNVYASKFNKATEALMRKLCTTNERMKYSIGSTYQIVSSIMENPHKLGICSIPHKLTSKLAVEAFYTWSAPFVTPITFKELVEDDR
ncbi:GDSL esterase/lipase [Acorus gramineus]|uniref:GDSL esterase/lipase n=1 Tax=Acorus gramineus TaxID=55184 RepID=A0AAV9AAY2_ACOGR|nr:GDSL esterase/lipase [Acorus gramineus]